MKTPTIEQLIAFAAGETPPNERASVEAAIDADPSAAAVVNAWRTAKRLASSDDGVEPPASTLARAKAIFASRAASAAESRGARGWIDAIERFIAKVVYDSRLQPAAVRYADAHDRITLTFETDAGEVDLQAERLAGGDSSWRIMGQIAEADSAGREVAVVDRATRESIAQGVASAHGEFAFEVRSGEHEVLIRHGETAVVLGPIMLT